VGDSVGQSCPTKHWLEALDMAVNRQCPNGARGQGMSLMSDHGCQPTSLALMQACHTLGIHQAFTSDNNPKGHAETERMRRTLKEACLWLTAWSSPSELIRALEAWVEYDNDHDLHSSLGDKTPRQFEREYQHRHSTPFVAA
jgi:putative transposase